MSEGIGHYAWNPKLREATLITADGVAWAIVKFGEWSQVFKDELREIGPIELMPFRRRGGPVVGISTDDPEHGPTNDS